MTPRALRIRITGEFDSYAAALERVPIHGDAAVVVRGRPRWLLIRCPDGCGDVVPVNLDERAGPAWRLIRAASGWSVYPSVWREVGCQAHFIVWRSRIWWGDWDDDSPQDSALEERIVNLLDGVNQRMSALEIADRIGEEPWMVGTACRRLARLRRIASQGPVSNRTYCSIRTRLEG